MANPGMTEEDYQNNVVKFCESGAHEMCYQMYNDETDGIENKMVPKNL